MVRGLARKALPFPVGLPVLVQAEGRAEDHLLPRAQAWAEGPSRPSSCSSITPGIPLNALVS